MTVPVNEYHETSKNSDSDCLLIYLPSHSVCNIFQKVVFCLARRSEKKIICSSTYTTVSIDSEADNKGPDQPARMHRLIRACVVRELHKDPFHVLCNKWKSWFQNCNPQNNVDSYLPLFYHILWENIGIYISNTCYRNAGVGRTSPRTSQ